MNNKLVIILTSLDNPATAKDLARQMIESGLVACVQISAAGESIYRWQGRIEPAAEHYLTIKTTMEKLEDALNWLRKHHPYDIPELVWWQVNADSRYAAWVKESLKPESPSDSR